MDYRVDQLAEAADVSVDTVRFYQAKGLLPPPRREGRVAWYSDEHVERLDRIRRLQGRGLTLATIGRLLAGELDGADEALVTALAEPAAGGESLTIAELAERSGIPLALLQSLEREGLLVPGRNGCYTVDDVAVAKAGLRLLEHGLPLPELLELARRHHAAMREVAERAVELFDAHVRRPLRTLGLPEEEAAARLVAAFEELLPATTRLVAHHFTRTLLAVAQEHIERVGVPAELAAVEQAAR
ncbi:MAG TPA: MerR family transcriptional regulator [Acidimicrobiales bacterium]|nr:MerR family transcriptional regulator [Acidimicrobiales bacterium]